MTDRCIISNIAVKIQLFLKEFNQIIGKIFADKIECMFVTIEMILKTIDSIAKPNS